MNNNEKGNSDNDNDIHELFLKIHKYSDCELNNFDYKRVIRKDKRGYCGYYISLIGTKHLLFFSFIHSFDYNSHILKIYLFFFNFTVTFTVNALFFNDETLHKKYKEKNSYDLIFNLPQILYSTLISGFINGLIGILAMTNTYIINLKQETKTKDINKLKEKIIRIIKIKFLLFFIINLILLVLFWFYLACFCAVYKNTQIHLIKDALISFGTSMIYPFGIYLIPGILRIRALNAVKKDKKFMYDRSKALQLL